MRKLPSMWKCVYNLIRYSFKNRYKFKLSTLEINKNEEGEQIKLFD